MIETTIRQHKTHHISYFINENDILLVCSNPARNFGMFYASTCTLAR